MRTKMFVPTLLSTVLASTMASTVSAQGSGPLVFDSTNSALTGTVACNGGQPVAITPVEASTSDANGGLNEVSGSNLAANSCGFPLYSMQSEEGATYTSDTNTSDVGNGGNGMEQVSLLGGVVTYDAKTEYDLCAGSASDSTATINCQDNTQIQNLVFAGQPITGTFTQPTTFNALNVQVKIPGYCTGLALFTGSLTVDSVSQQQSGDTGSITSAPISLNGTLTCVGLPLASMTVNLQDPTAVNYEVRLALIIAVERGAITTLGANSVRTFQYANVANPNQ